MAPLSCHFPLQLLGALVLAPLSCFCNTLSGKADHLRQRTQLSRVRRNVCQWSGSEVSSLVVLPPPQSSAWVMLMCGAAVVGCAVLQFLALHSIRYGPLPLGMFPQFIHGPSFSLAVLDSLVYIGYIRPMCNTDSMYGPAKHAGTTQACMCGITSALLGCGSIYYTVLEENTDISRNPTREKIIFH